MTSAQSLPQSTGCPLPGRGQAAWCRSPAVIASLLGLAYAVVALVVSLRWHPIEIYGPENDRYVWFLDNFLAGGAAFDGFHPTHVHLFAAAVRGLCGTDSFTAFRITAAFGGGLAVACSWLLARRFSPGIVPWLVAAGVAGHVQLFLLSLQASSDSFGVGITMLALLLGVRAADSGHLRDVFLAAVGFGFANGTRSNAIALFPVLLFLLWGAGWWRRVLPMVIGTGLGFLPHAIVCMLEGKSPTFNLNWRNMPLKLSNFDPMAIHAPEYSGALDFLAHNGWSMLQLGLQDSWRALSGEFGRMLVRGGPPWLEAALAAIALLAALAMLPAGRAAAMIGLSWCAGLFLTCMTFIPGERILLPLMPISLLAIAHAAGRRQAAVRWPAIVVLVAIAVLNPMRAGPQWQWFLDVHPHAELEALRAFAAQPDAWRIGASYPSAERLVGTHVDILWWPRHDWDLSGTGAFDWLVKEQQRTGVTYLVVGRLTMHLLFEALKGDGHGGLTVVERTPDYVVLKRPLQIVAAPESAPWFAEPEFAPVEWVRGRHLSIRAKLQPAVAARVLDATLVAMVGDLPPVRQPLVRLSDAELGYDLHTRPPAGSYRTFVRLRLDDGTFVDSAEQVIAVR